MLLSPNSPSRSHGYIPPLHQHVQTCPMIGRQASGTSRQKSTLQPRHRSKVRIMTNVQAVTAGQAVAADTAWERTRKNTTFSTGSLFFSCIKGQPPFPPASCGLPVWLPFTSAAYNEPCPTWHPSQALALSVRCGTPPGTWLERLQLHSPRIWHHAAFDPTMCRRHSILGIYPLHCDRMPAAHEPNAPALGRKYSRNYQSCGCQPGNDSDSDARDR